MSIITKQKFDALVPAFRDATDSVYRKMVPQLELYENRTGEFAPYEELSELRERYICLAAAHNAVRSLDLILTGSGFGVISTAEKSPASQARVDALQRQLYEECSDVFDELRTKRLEHGVERDEQRTGHGGLLSLHPDFAEKIRSFVRRTRGIYKRIRAFGTTAPRGSDPRVARDFARTLRSDAQLVEKGRRVSHRRQFTATTCDENALGKGTRPHGTRYDSGADP